MAISSSAKPPLQKPLARGGDKNGLDQLFADVPAADARQCEILAGALKELLGSVLSEPASSKKDDANALAEWKQNVQRWSAAHLEKLQFDPAPEVRGARWK